MAVQPAAITPARLLASFPACGAGPGSRCGLEPDPASLPVRVQAAPRNAVCAAVGVRQRHEVLPDLGGRPATTQHVPGGQRGSRHEEEGAIEGCEDY